MNKKFAILGSAALLAPLAKVTPAIAAPGNSGLNCQVGQTSTSVDVDYQFRGDVFDGLESIDIVYVNGETSTVVGTATFNSPATGQISVALDEGYEVAFCVKGGLDREESEWLSDGGATYAVTTPSGQLAGVSNYAYVVKRSSYVS